VAVVREVHGHSVLILGAGDRSGSPNVLGTAGAMALTLANRAGTSIGSSTLVHAGEVVARVSVVGNTVAARAGSTADFLSWPGVTAERLLVDDRTIRAGADKGTKVGSVVVALASNER